MRNRTVRLGPYSAGEKPAPIEVTITESDGITPINIQGYEARWVYKLGSTETTRVAVLSNGPAGKAMYTWVEADLASPGEYVAQMWVGNGTHRLASVPFVYTVTRQTTAPAI